MVEVQPTEDQVEARPTEESEAMSAVEIKEVQTADSDVWRAKPEQTSKGAYKVNTIALLTNQTDSKVLHAKLVDVKDLLRKSRLASKIAWASIITGPVALVVFPVGMIVSASIRNKAYRQLNYLK